ASVIISISPRRRTKIALPPGVGWARLFARNEPHRPPGCPHPLSARPPCRPRRGNGGAFRDQLAHGVSRYCRAGRGGSAGGGRGGGGLPPDEGLPSAA